MAGSFSEEEIRRFESYRNVHLKKEQQRLSISEQIQALEKRDRNKWYHVLINIAVIIAFGYSYYFDITQLSQTLLVILLIVFTINVVLIFYQKKQINETIAYLEWKQSNEDE